MDSLNLRSAAKSLLKSFLETAPAPLQRAAVPVLKVLRRLNRVYVLCYGPNDKDPRPLRGQIAIRGRCFTVRADDLVEVTLGSLPPARITPTLSMRDQRLQKVAAQTGHCDFVATFDSSPLANGSHRITVRLLSNGKAVRDFASHVNIDHQRGFASEYARWIEDFERPNLDRLRSALPGYAYRPRIAVIGNASGPELATADYICWTDPGTTLASDALAYVVEALNHDREIDLLYGDDDEMGPDGERTKPFFKPAWSPDLAQSMNYLGGFVVLKRELFASLEFEDGYDLMLRASGRAAKIHRIPHVLSHRPSTSAPASLPVHATGRIEAGRFPGSWRARYDIPSQTFLSIIIPSGGGLDVLSTNLQSLVAENAFTHFEILIVDNSRSDDIQHFIDRDWKHEPRLRWLDCRNQAFNYSVLNNYAVTQCRGDVLLFLNDDTSASARDWISAMLEHALRPEVGAVGAKLLYPSGLIQHGSVVMGLYENCGHAFKGLSGQTPHYFGLSDVVRNVSAVTGACLMTRRTIFEQVGGFDEKTFAVAFNDVDLCLKIGSLGYRILYNPFAVLYHHEAFSKSSEDLEPASAEVAAMKSKWASVIADDPFYSPNLTRKFEDYSLARKLPR